MCWFVILERQTQDVVPYCGKYLPSYFGGKNILFPINLLTDLLVFVTFATGFCFGDGFLKHRAVYESLICGLGVEILLYFRGKGGAATRRLIKWLMICTWHGCRRVNTNFNEYRAFANSYPLQAVIFLFSIIHSRHVKYSYLICVWVVVCVVQGRSVSPALLGDDFLQYLWLDPLSPGDFNDYSSLDQSSSTRWRMPTKTPPVRHVCMYVCIY